MKMNRNIPVMLIVFTLAWSVNVRAQIGTIVPMGSMVMDSAPAPRAHTDSTSKSPLYWSKLTLKVRQGDTCNFATARLTSPISGDGVNPIPNATVSFYVQRLFGLMPIGADDNTAATDDSGFAELAFPKDLPGDGQGNVIIVARIEDNALTGPLVARDSGKLGISLPIAADPFPRALWEPRAPFALIITFCILLGGVWITYGFVLSQLFYIKRKETT